MMTLGAAPQKKSLLIFAYLTLCCYYIGRFHTMSIVTGWLIMERKEVTPFLYDVFPLFGKYVGPCYATQKREKREEILSIL